MIHQLFLQPPSTEDFMANRLQNARRYARLTGLFSASLSHLLDKVNEFDFFSLHSLID